MFPYPYIIEALDKYYKVKTSKSKKQSADKDEKKKTAKNTKKKKLSVLIATFWDYPHTGGLSNYITSLSDGLKKQGHKVSIISPNQFSSTTVAALRKAVVPEIKDFFTERYGTCNSKILQSTRLLYIYEELVKNMNLEKYDIFIAQDLFTANILGRLNQSYNKPLIFTPHGMFTFSRLKFNRIDKGSVEEVYYKQMEAKAIEFASHLIILSDSFRAPLKELGAVNDKMTTITTGIEYKSKSSKKAMADKKKLVITIVARLRPRKGHHDLFNALSEIEHYTKNIDVLIVGDGEMRTALEEQANSLKLSMIKFLGTREDVPDILSTTDLFVLPTLNDNLPISIIEAMHSGTAVISTNCGGIPEIIKHMDTGMIIEPGHTAELANALKLLISDKELRETLGTNAKAFAQQHLTRDAMISKMEQKYFNLLGMGDGSNEA
ncbi:glycosyltransferase family 4 protein [Jeotgalibacillus soli]|nr:glycosyltransferase family 4 protein [Jeotgalibacillus soli]